MNASTHSRIAALLIAIGIASAGWLVSQGLERLRMADRSVVIKGLAEQDVESDYATWSLAFRRAAGNFMEVQKALAADREKVLAFLDEAGFTKDELEVRPLLVRDAYSAEYANANQPFRYTGNGLVLVSTGRIDKVEAAALATDPLISQGVVLDTGNGPRYELRAFNEAKGPLLAEATRNAREQAEAFAADAGARLGPLRNANQGVIQIHGSSSQGWDDGTSRSKRLRVVSTFEYELR
ncbi:MAG: SIMPL domain-containing protein [Chromatocurvus sp.]